MHNVVNHLGMACSNLQKHFFDTIYVLELKQHVIVITDIDGKRDVLLIKFLQTNFAVSDSEVHT